MWKSFLYYAIENVVPDEEVLLGTKLENFEAAKSNELSADQIIILKRMFQVADIDGNKCLDIDEFKIVMKKIFKDEVSDDELEELFYRFDLDQNGTLELDEFLNFLLIDYNESRYLISREVIFLKDDIKSYTSKVRGHIIKIVFYPTLSKLKSSNLYYATGKYITLNIQGSIEIWSLQMQHQKSVKLLNTPDGEIVQNFENKIEPKFTRFDAHQGIIFTLTFTCLPNVSMIAISASDGSVYFYSIGTVFEKKYQLMGFGSCIQSLSYWYDEENENESILLTGDLSGNVIIFIFSDCLRSALFPVEIYERKTFCRQLRLNDLIKKQSEVFKIQKYASLHKHTVKEVRYFPEVNSFVSISDYSVASMAFVNIYDKSKIKLFSVNRGILCFDYHPASGLIVTGGCDHDVKTWNPYLVGKCTNVLSGHHSPVLYVKIYTKGKQMLISVSEDKMIKVWNIYESLCIMTIHPFELQIGHFNVSDAFFNPIMETLFVISKFIGVIQSAVKGLMEHEARTNKRSVTSIKYNPIFNQAITSGDDSTISTWDVNTGEKLLHFNAYTNERDKNALLPVTAMNLDHDFRRILTGTVNGTVKIWNFCTGKLLYTFETEDSSKICCITTKPGMFFISGWSKKISVFRELRMEHETSQKIYLSRVWKHVHTDDIITMEVMAPNLVISGGYDGKLIVWRDDTGIFSVCDDKWRKSIADRNNVLNNRQKLDHVTNNSDKSKFEKLRPYMNLKQKLRLIDDNMRNIFYKDSSAIITLLALHNRMSNMHTATLLVGKGNGLIEAWNLCLNVFIMDAFAATIQPLEYVTAMTTDNNNEFLFTGDSQGYVSVWFIANFANDSETVVDHELFNNKFPFLSHVGKEFKRLGTEGDYRLSTSKPRLLNSFRAHLDGITSIDFVSTKEVIMTSSKDCSARLWTIAGRYIGIFGQDLRWNIFSLDLHWQTTAKLPADIRRVASITSLKVLHGGKSVNWKKAYNIIVCIQIVSLFASVKEKVATVPEDKILVVKDLDIKDSELMEINNYIKKIQTIPEDHILKTSLSLPPIRVNKDKIAIYHILPCFLLDDIPKLDKPQNIRSNKRNKRC